MEDVRYDYVNQAWIVNGRYEPCNHPSCTQDNTDCYGTKHQGEVAKTIGE